MRERGYRVFAEDDDILKEVEDCDMIDKIKKMGYLVLIKPETLAELNELKERLTDVTCCSRM